MHYIPDAKEKATVGTRVRKLTTESSIPMRFAIDYLYLKDAIPLAKDGKGKIIRRVPNFIGQEKYDYLLKKLIPSVMMHLEQSYEVYDKLGVDVSALWLKESEKKKIPCGPVEMNHLGGPYKAHYLVVFGYEFSSEDRIAMGAPCVAKNSDKRPVVGYILINFE